jgi:tRNA threonylcarbamoyladenosine biosynthesis protein TsaE
MSRRTGLDEAALTDLGRHLGQRLRPGDVVALAGPLGVGKTTLARALLRGAGLDNRQEVPSPTYTLVQPYAPPDLPFPIWHVDLYRLDGPAGVAGLGLDDHLDGGGALLVEWPERWGAGLPVDALRLTLEPDGPLRHLHMIVPPGWASRLGNGTD